MSAYERYRRELAVLAEDGPIRTALGLDAGWRRTYGRFFPDAEPFAVLTLEKGERLLRVDVHRGMRFVATDVTVAGTVRYHPDLRRTIRRGDRFGKLAGDGPRLLERQRSLWAVRGRLAFAIAEPLGYEDGVAWFAAVPGTRPDFTPELAGRTGAALATLARVEIEAPAYEDRAAAAARELVRRVPAVARDVRALLDAPLEPGPPRPLHGAPHPPQ